jgi:mRNA interferase MazF
LQIVIPITSWQNTFQSDFWMIRLPSNSITGLNNESAANAFQVKSISEQRFATQIGRVSDQHLDDIVSAIALLIGFNPT